MPVRPYFLSPSFKRAVLNQSDIVPRICAVSGSTHGGPAATNQRAVQFGPFLQLFGQYGA